MGCGCGAGTGKGSNACVRTVAPAKINLYLGVTTSRDERGYHLANSLMCALDLHDEVEVELSSEPGIELACSPEATSSPRDNLAWRAADALARRWGIEPRLRIRIEKRIPAQAGLGGGSSDAAAVLRCLRELWGAGQPSARDAELGEIARSLGADVAFFLHDRPCLLGNLGDEPQRYFDHLAMPLVLVRPDAGVSTARAYQAFDADPIPPADLAPLVEALESRDGAGVCAHLSNNLTQAACSVQPKVAEVLSFLERFSDGRSPALLCGSGSACALMVPDASSALSIEREARASGYWACATSTREKDWSMPWRCA
jgi:4-diphosphocytidyl-2-C-methyl-D-erythritol kinase